MIFQSKVDKIFRTKPRAEFAFDKSVARVFSNMIHRSVPGYRTTLEMIEMFAARYVQGGSNCYDLGTSLGAAARSIQRGIRVSGCTIIAVDSSADMLGRARRRPMLARPTIRFRQERAENLRMENASMVVLNYTLQFIEPKKRTSVLQSIYNALVPEGICIVSEKFASEESEEAQYLSQFHDDFKRYNGYSEEEIVNKRASLQKILLPSTRAQFEKNCKEAGFAIQVLFLQNLAFHSYFLQKAPARSAHFSTALHTPDRSSRPTDRSVPSSAPNTPSGDIPLQRSVPPTVQ